MELKFASCTNLLSIQDGPTPEVSDATIPKGPLYVKDLDPEEYSVSGKEGCCYYLNNNVFVYMLLTRLQFFCFVFCKYVLL